MCDSPLTSSQVKGLPLFWALQGNERWYGMDGEQNGTQGTQVAQQENQQQQTTQQPQQEAQQGKLAQGAAAGVDAEAFEAQLDARDSRIEELEAQIAEAAKSAEAADGLREEIAALKKQGEDERIEFSLMLAGCRTSPVVFRTPFLAV